MLWNKPEEFSVILNTFIRQQRFINLLHKLVNPTSEIDKVINLEILKSIKKCLNLLTISNKNDLDNFIKNYIKRLKTINYE